MAPAVRPINHRPCLFLTTSNHYLSFIRLTAKDHQTSERPFNMKEEQNGQKDSSLRGNRKCRKCQFKIICRTLRVATEDSISTKIEDTVHRNKDPNKAFRNLKNMVCKNKNLIAVLEAKSRKSPKRNKKKV